MAANQANSPHLESVVKLNIFTYVELEFKNKFYLNRGVWGKDILRRAQDDFRILCKPLLFHMQIPNLKFVVCAHHAYWLFCLL